MEFLKNKEAVRAHGMDIFLYLSASGVLKYGIYIADNYENMSLPCVRTAFSLSSVSETSINETTTK